MFNTMAVRLSLEFKKSWLFDSGDIAITEESAELLSESGNGLIAIYENGEEVYNVSR